MTDPRFISPSNRVPVNERCPGVQCYGSSSTYREMYNEALDHAAFMDERDARQRDLIRRLAEAIQEDLEWCESVGREPCRTCKLIAEARGIEATNA